jgi:hypothetical protein
LKSPGYNAAAKIILIAALMFCVGYDNEELKDLYSTHSQSWAVESFVGGGFLLSTLPACDTHQEAHNL